MNWYDEIDHAEHAAVQSQIDAENEAELTAETHRIRVETIMAEGHTPTEARSLGYPRQVCATCGCNWPCPDFAQAAEWA